MRTNTSGISTTGTIRELLPPRWTRCTPIPIPEPTSSCSLRTKQRVRQSFYQEIHLLPNSLFPAFQYEITNCADSVVIPVTDLSTGFFGFLYRGMVLGIGEYPNVHGAKPRLRSLRQHEPAADTHRSIRKRLQEEETSVWIPAFLIEEEIADTLLVCKGDSIPLNTVYDPMLGYI